MSTPSCRVVSPNGHHDGRRQDGRARDTVRKAIADGDVDFLRDGVRVLAQAVIEAEVSELTGAAKGKRNRAERLTHRNGYRERRWDTREGTIDLAVPRVRDGSYTLGLDPLPFCIPATGVVETLCWRLVMQGRRGFEEARWVGQQHR